MLFLVVREHDNVVNSGKLKKKERFSNPFLLRGLFFFFFFIYLSWISTAGVTYIRFCILLFSSVCCCSTLTKFTLLSLTKMTADCMHVCVIAATLLTRRPSFTRLLCGVRTDAMTAATRAEQNEQRTESCFFRIWCFAKKRKLFCRLKFLFLTSAQHRQDPRKLQTPKQHNRHHIQHGIAPPSLREIPYDSFLRLCHTPP